MYIWWVCTRAARKENPNLNANSHDHCLLSKWKCRICVRVLICATRQKPCRKRVYRNLTSIDREPSCDKRGRNRRTTGARWSGKASDVRYDVDSTQLVSETCKHTDLSMYILVQTEWRAPLMTWGRLDTCMYSYTNISRCTTRHAAADSTRWLPSPQSPLDGRLDYDSKIQKFRWQVYRQKHLSQDQNCWI